MLLERGCIDMHVEQARLITRESKCESVTVEPHVADKITYVNFLIGNTARHGDTYCKFYIDDHTVVDQLYPYYEERGFRVGINTGYLSLSWEKPDE